MLAAHDDAILVQDAAHRVRKGLDGLKVHLQLEDRYFESVAGLASDWHVRPSRDFASSADAAPFFVDLRIPAAEVSPEKSHRIDLYKNSDGSLLVSSNCSLSSES